MGVESRAPKAEITASDEIPMTEMEQIVSQGAAMSDAAEIAPPAICLSVVIPVYNEKNTLEELLRRVRQTPIDKEIIIVDDGSTDGTRELLQSMQGAPDLRIVFQERNRGKGAAV